jgi:ATP-dependent protease HslVU (ClpYQ) peptidase subunit
MTVIAYDGTSIATDRQSTSGGLKTLITKSMRLKDGTVLAVAGPTATGLLLMDLYKKKQLIRKWPETQDKNDFAILVVARKGKVVFYEYQSTAIPVQTPIFAWGAGREIAIGAMAFGATAEQAVQIASKWDNTCGLGVDNYRLR